VRSHSVSYILLTPPAERARIVPVPQGRTCCTTTWAALLVTTVRRQVMNASHMRRSSATSAPIQDAPVRPWATRATRELVRWPRTNAVPAGTSLPQRPPRRASCAVFGNVFDAASTSFITGTATAIDLYIENTTYYYNWDGGNHHLQNTINGDFAQINLDGPNLYAAAATLGSVAFTESRGRSGACSPRAAFDQGLSPTKVRLFSDPAPQPAALCASVGTFGFEAECASWRWLVISLLVVACVLGARDARKQPNGGRSRCAQGRASAASPRQKTPLPRPGYATTQLRPVVILCLVSAASAARLATNVACLPYRSDEVFLDLSGARAAAFLEGVPRR